MKFHPFSQRLFISYKKCASHEIDFIKIYKFCLECFSMRCVFNKEPVYNFALSAVWCLYNPVFWSMECIGALRSFLSSLLWTRAPLCAGANPWGERSVCSEQPCYELCAAGLCLSENEWKFSLLFLECLFFKGSLWSDHLLWRSWPSVWPLFPKQRIHLDEVVWWVGGLCTKSWTNLILVICSLW
jgi:hypothetical protein